VELHHQSPLCKRGVILNHFGKENFKQKLTNTHVFTGKEKLNILQLHYEYIKASNDSN
jgi:hypothetical protein